jgi:hypothetical protein
MIAAMTGCPRRPPPAGICEWPPMIFIVKKASDQAFEEEREIYSIAALVELADGLEHELVLSRNLLRDHPVILICDRPVE